MHTTEFSRKIRLLQYVILYIDSSFEIKSNKISMSLNTLEKYKVQQKAYSRKIKLGIKAYY